MSQILPVDPFELKHLSKLHPYRLIWTAYNRVLDRIGNLIQKPLIQEIKNFSPEYSFPERGGSISDTAVTCQQMELLKIAVEKTTTLCQPIVEIGTYRGITTKHLASITPEIYYAVDPYIGYGGCEDDLAIFLEQTKDLKNIKLLRKTSGSAYQELQPQALSFVFIDAVHDFPNTWFDFFSWSSLVTPGGLIAMHDVDDFPGTYLAFRKIVARREKFRLWGYCPNLAIVQKLRD